MGGKKFVYTKNYFFYSVVGLTFHSPLIFVSIIQRCVGLFLKMLESNPGPLPQQSGALQFLQIIRRTVAHQAFCQPSHNIVLSIIKTSTL